ncbi:MAG: response regulator transcription factor [Candidatus Lindowbacteria bacterium]|nr:response regulator transcription factor [Candidatus Lindowbacteria bacterium]
MGEKKRIVIAEGHAIVRAGLRCLFTGCEDMEVVGEAEDGLAAVRCAEANNAQLILMDASMPKMDGIAAVKQIKRLSPERKILLLGVQKSEISVVEVFQSGADGYCLKKATPEELLEGVRTVLAGRRYVSPGIPTEICANGPDSGTSRMRSAVYPLTEREREILKLIGECYKNKEIAHYLSISVKTVEKHRANLMRKLDLHSASAVTAYAIEKGLVAK